MTSSEVIDRLRARYTARPGEVVEWAFFEQVRAGTGAYAQRTSDAVAMNLWESRGLAVHGFEVKVSRSDWQREMRQPEKADPLVARCDFWWLVVSDSDIVRDGELPEGWGLMVPHATGFKVAKQAAKNPTANIDRGFVASLLRRIDRDSITAKHVLDAVTRTRDEQKRAIESARADVAEYKARVTAMRDAVGVRFGSVIPDWYSTEETWAEFGRRLGLSFEAPGKAEKARDDLKRFVQSLRHQADSIEELLVTAPAHLPDEPTEHNGQTAERSRAADAGDPAPISPTQDGENDR